MRTGDELVTWVIWLAGVALVAIGAAAHTSGTATGDSLAVPPVGVELPDPFAPQASSDGKTGR